MPPTTKSKTAAKAKSPAVVDGVSADEMSKDEMEEHIVRLREELDREREERSYFQLERDKIRAFWEICKRNLEEAKAELRNRQREREEAEERHRVEISVYKQKLKHVLSEHHEEAAGLKTDAAASVLLIQDQHTGAELRLRGEIQGRRADVRDKKLQAKHCEKQLQLKHLVQLMETANECDQRIREMETKHQREMVVMAEEEAKRHKEEMKQLEEKMKSRITDLLYEHDQQLSSAQEAFASRKQTLLSHMETFKIRLANVTEQKSNANAQLSAAQQHIRRLTQDLQDAQQKLPELHRQLQDCERAKAELVVERAREKLVEKELRDLRVEHELLLQAFDKVEQERDQLLKKQMEVMVEVQQRSGLKELLVERKLAALTETLDKKSAQLCAALSAFTVDRSAADKVQETFESKQVTVDSLRGDLSQDCEEYDGLLQTCRDRLKDLDVSLHDFPFRTSNQILGGRSQVQTSAGPAS